LCLSAGHSLFGTLIDGFFLQQLMQEKIVAGLLFCDCNFLSSSDVSLENTLSIIQKININPKAVNMPIRKAHMDVILKSYKFCNVMTGLFCNIHTHKVR